MGDINYIMEQLDNLKDNPIQYPTITTKKAKRKKSSRKKLKARERIRKIKIKEEKKKVLDNYDFSEIGKFTEEETNLYFKYSWYTINDILRIREENLNYKAETIKEHTIYDKPKLFTNDKLDKMDKDILKLSEYDYFEKTDTDELDISDDSY